MDNVVRLQNIPSEADYGDIREYFTGLSISECGIDIVGGKRGECFVLFRTEQDARQAIQKDGEEMKDSRIRVKSSSRYEMVYVKNQMLYDGSGDVSFTKEQAADLNNVRRRLARLSIKDGGESRKRSRSESESPPRKFAKTDNRKELPPRKSSDEPAVLYGNGQSFEKGQDEAAHHLHIERQSPRIGPKDSLEESALFPSPRIGDQQHRIYTAKYQSCEMEITPTRTFGFRGRHDITLSRGNERGSPELRDADESIWHRFRQYRNTQYGNESTDGSPQVRGKDTVRKKLF